MIPDSYNYNQQTSKSLKIFLGFWIGYYIYMMLNGIVIPKGSAVALIFSCTVFTYIIYCNLFLNKYINKFILIYVYLLYIALLIFLFSSNYFASYRLWVKYSNGLLCLPVAFNLISEDTDRKETIKMLIVFIILFIVNYALANILHLGGSRYGTEEGIETGNLFDEALYLNVCALILLPYMFLYIKKYRMLLLIAYALNIVVTIVCFKRTVILCIIISIALFIFLYQLLNKKHVSIPFVGNILSKRQVTMTLISILVLGGIFAGIFMAQLESRGNRIGADLSSETRTQELELIIKDIIYNKSDKTFFLGQETFNTVGTYAGGIFGKRMIHENYGIMLNGGGIIGLTFYLIVYFWILYLFFKYTKGYYYLNTDLEARLLYIAFLCLWIVFLIASFSGTIWLTIYPAICHTLQGMILRYFYNGQNKED